MYVSPDKTRTLRLSSNSVQLFCKAHDELLSVAAFEQFFFDTRESDDTEGFQRLSTTVNYLCCLLLHVAAYDVLVERGADHTA